MTDHDRRGFIRRMVLAGGATAIGGAAVLGKPDPIRTVLAAETAPAHPAAGPWARQMGLELWTVRDLLAVPTAREAALARVAALGYSEIEPDHGPSGGYLGLSPRAFRALLERLGLTMPSTHLAVREGPELPRQLEGLATMGLKYVVIGPAGSGAIGIPGQMRMTGPAPSSSEVRRDCEALNRYGRMAHKFGLKVLVHNHTMEFAPLADDAARCAYDLYLAETDPALVAMQLDIGWAAVAGQDIVAWFHKAPGRFELWHVKDASNIRLMPRTMSEEQRAKVAQLVPVGLGDVDYGTIFAHAALAGLRHYCVEQDNAAAWGDSLAAARVSRENLLRLLSGAPVPTATT